MKNKQFQPGAKHNHNTDRVPPHHGTAPQQTSKARLVRALCFISGPVVTRRGQSSTSVCYQAQKSKQQFGNSRRQNYAQTYLQHSSGTDQQPQVELKSCSWTQGDRVSVKTQVRLVRAIKAYWCPLGPDTCHICTGKQTNVSWNPYMQAAPHTTLILLNYSSVLILLRYELVTTLLGDPLP